MKARTFSLILVALLVILAAAIALIPTGVKWFASSWLEQQGLNSRINEVQFSLLDSRFSISGVSGTNQQGKGFQLGEFAIDFSWRPLNENILQINTIRVDQLKLDTTQDGNHLSSIAGIDLAQFTNTDSASTETTTANNDGDEAATNWQVQLGNINLKDIELCHHISASEQQVCTRFNQLNWTGDIIADTNSALNIDGNIELLEFQINDIAGEQQLLSNQLLTIDDVSIKQLDDITIDNFTIDNFMLMLNNQQQTASETDNTATTSPAVAYFNQFQINDIKIKQQSTINIESIVLTGIGADIVRDQQAQWQVLQRLNDLIPPPNEQTTNNDSEASETEPSTQTIVINNVTIKDGQALHFLDQSLESPFEISTVIEEISVTNIDLNNTAATSDVKLAINIDDGGLIAINGQLTSLATPSDFDFKGELKAIDLRPIGAYLQSSVGSTVKSGHLNAGLSAKTVEGKIDGEMALNLQQFQLKNLTTEQSDTLNSLFGLPVNTALNLLRDRDNSIKLDIPVSGDINNPEFNPSKIITKAVSKIVLDQIVSYYTPFGLVAVTEGLIDLHKALLFEPVHFAIASDEIAQEQITALNKLEKLLLDRPNIAVTLCGYSNAQDAEALNIKPTVDKESEALIYSQEQKKQLIQLATNRSSIIKSTLMTRNIPADKLIICSAEFEEDAINGVDVKI
jgi:hypothetical protein